ncbi:sensor histidine kinase [Lysinibacillus sp. FSL K6-0232]|uniref:sensor histidine kinase n=1 Tax=unclassified Lysinibacillus TaxID=2636778 RepID=UPI0030F6D407
MKKWIQSLTAKMIFLISILILFICGIFVYLLQTHIRDITEEQMGIEALHIAKTVASMEEIIAAFNEDNPSEVIQPIAESIRTDIDAAFIVVGNAEGIRYSHPITDKIGSTMVGGDNDAVLIDRQAYISKTMGSLGESIRGKAPIIQDDKIIGVVSVGFLTNNIKAIIDSYMHKWSTYIIIILLVGILGAIAISIYIRRLLFNMEPNQIAKLYQQNKVILETTEEGIIAVDQWHQITTINKSAYEILDSTHHKSLPEWMGTKIEHIFTPKIVEEEVIHNLELPLEKHIIILNKAPLVDKKRKIGSLYTFRKKVDIQKIIDELKQIKQYANVQRAYTHEFANKLHIILGLLVHKHYNEAIEFIKEEQNIQLKNQAFLNSNITSPLLLALIQGKIAEAAELGIKLELQDIPSTIQLSKQQENALLTALGNVLQNAIEALKNVTLPDKRIQLSINDYKNHYLLEIQDNGPGINNDVYDHIFIKGTSTKKGMDRGHGLAISKQALQEINGDIVLDTGDLPGACFLIFIPKGGNEHDTVTTRMDC